MEGRRIIFANNVRLEGAEAAFDGRTVWLFMYGKPMKDTLPLVSNPKVTNKITFQFGEMEQVYEGFTHLKALTEDETGSQACLIKEG